VSVGHVFCFLRRTGRFHSFFFVQVLWMAVSFSVFFYPYPPSASFPRPIRFFSLFASDLSRKSFLFILHRAQWSSLSVNMKNENLFFSFLLAWETPRCRNFFPPPFSFREYEWRSLFFPLPERFRRFFSLFFSPLFSTRRARGVKLDDDPFFFPSFLQASPLVMADRYFFFPSGR